MTGAVVLALASHWRRHPFQFATLILGLALATALWTAVQAINAEARASYDKAARFLETGQAGALTHPDGVVPFSTFVALRRAGWQVSPVLESRLKTDHANLTIMGVDFLSYPGGPALTGGALSPADLLSPPSRLLVGPQTERALTGVAGLPPRVVVDWAPEGVAMTDIGVAETLLGKPGALTRLLVLKDQPTGLPPLADIAPELRFQASDAMADIAGLTRSFHLNLTAFGLLSFAVGLFIVHGMVGLSFEQRRATLRTLMALGTPNALLARVLLVELVGLGLMAGALGVALGYVLAAALLPDVAATLRGLYGAPGVGALTLRPGWALAGLGMAVSGVLLAGGQMLWRARAMPILSLAGDMAWRGRGRTGLKIQTMAGLGLIAAGCATIWIWSGLLAGFAFLGGLMLGGALLLPPLLSVILKAASTRARRPIAQWVWSDMHAQLPGLSLAMMALLLALATNIGVGSMVGSFRLTFVDYLDGRLSADLYIGAKDPDETAAIRAWLIPRSDAVLPLRSVKTPLAGRPARIYGIVDDPVYRASWPILRGHPDMWNRLFAGDGVLVNEQLARRSNLWPGAMVALAPGWSAEVLGVYADYGNPDGQAVAALPDLLRVFPDTPDLRMAVRSQTPDDLARALRDAFDLPADAITLQADLKSRSLAIFERTFVVTGALNALTLGVAAFAILTSLSTLWMLRLPQLAPAWALGMTRAQLAWLEILRSVALAGLTALAALPLGLALAWALLSIIQVEAFGWRLPMHVFPRDWVGLSLLALLAAALAAALPALRLFRLPPSELLKVFAHAR